VLDGVRDDAHDVEVRVADQVGDVAVHKGVARLQARDLLGGDARVAASDPQVLGVLAGRQLDEELGVLGFLVGGPAAVVLKDALVRLAQVVADVVLGHGAPVGGVFCL
jgi:hypothetical protein